MVIAAGAQAQPLEEATKTLSPYFFIKSSNPSVDQFPLKSTSAGDLEILPKAPPSPGEAFLILSIDFSLF
jgi:hypothetical protein